MKRAISLLLASSLSYAGTPPPLDEVLRRAGKAVEDFAAQFSSVDCVEEVSQLKLGNGGSIAYRQDSAFDYLIVLHVAGNDLSVEESRMPLKSSLAAKKGETLPLLVTGGFSMLLFVFHPMFQSGFEYSQPEFDSPEGGRPLLRVRFRHVHGARSPTVLVLRRRQFPIEWQGTAWLDPETGAVTRVSASLAVSMEDVGLKTLNADVRYAPVAFKDGGGLHWLPETAAIEAETPRQHWRNVHRFTNYKQFSVSTKTEVESSK